MLVDSVHGHVFLALGDVVLVRDLAGGAVATIPNQQGASRMFLSDDSATLYVPLAAGHAVTAISTTTLTETARYDTGANTCPRSVAVTNAKIWFTYGCYFGLGNLGVIDPNATPAATVTLRKVDDDYALTDPTGLVTPGSGLLLSADMSYTSDGIEMRRIDVSTGNAVLSTPRNVGNNLSDFALSADKAHVYTASENPFILQAFLTTDLSADGTYGESVPPQNSVTTASNGVVAAGSSYQYSPAVHVYRADRSEIRSYDWAHGTPSTAGKSTVLAPAGLAFAADGSRLYAVTVDAYASNIVLHVLTDPTKPPGVIGLTKPTSAAINQPITINGTLTSDLPIPAGQTVEVERDSTYGTVALPSVTTSGTGAFTITDTVTQRGAYGYRASWAGDDTHAAGTTRITFAVKGLATSVSITTGAGPYSYGAKPLVVAHLGTTKVRTLSLYAQPYGGAKTLVKSGVVDGNGNLSLAYTITRHTTFTASFAGDDTYEPTYAAKALLSHASVGSALQGYYGTSGAYRLFHTSKDPTIVVSVAPNNAGTCMSYLSQRYYSGAWHNSTSVSCKVLDSTSHGKWILASSAPAGTLYRIRATFKGNSRNVATNGAWQYVKFTS
jgi:hypothetical protein